MERIEVITSVEERGDEKFVTVGLVLEQAKEKPIQTSRYTVSERGLWRCEALRSNVKGYWVLKLPHKQDLTWEETQDKWPAFHKYPVKSKYISKGPERVKVPVGEYEAIKVEWRSERGDELYSTSWYAPEVGLVKAEH